MTTLAQPLVVVRSVEPCDGGQCAGEVTLYTDLTRSAYAVVHPEAGRGYLAGDCPSVVRKVNGDIEVKCAAVNLGDQECDGTATFTHTDLTQHSEWLEPTRDILAWLSPMDRE